MLAFKLPPPSRPSARLGFPSIVPVQPLVVCQCFLTTKTSGPLAPDCFNLVLPLNFCPTSETRFTGAGFAHFTNPSPTGNPPSSVCGGGCFSWSLFSPGLYFGYSERPKRTRKVSSWAGQDFPPPFFLSMAPVLQVSPSMLSSILLIV